jgi:4-hydroxybenzoate polyprenyltransferase
MSGLFALHIADTVFRPLWQRLRLGEGGLIGMATWAAACESRDPFTTAAVLVATTLLLAAIYLFNDVSDRWIDAHNPKKHAAHREALVRQPRLFLCIAVAMHLAIAAFAWRLLGPWAGICAALLLVLNPLYSAVVKGIPGLDVLLVGTMGGAVVGVASSSSGLIALAGAMTGISHAFQTRVDFSADRSAGISTSATAPLSIRGGIWLALFAALASIVYLRLGLAGALSAALPYALLTSSIDAHRAWAWARLYFGAVWVVATLS